MSTNLRFAEIVSTFSGARFVKYPSGTQGYPGIYVIACTSIDVVVYSTTISMIHGPCDTRRGHDGVRSCLVKWRAIQDKSANTYVIEIAM